MTKNEVIAQLADALTMPKAQVKRVVDTLVDTVSKTLVRGEKVQIHGLGTFEVKHRKAREGRNPQTNSKITIPAHNAVGFSPATPLKDAVK